jgi:hypothetical protein
VNAPINNIDPSGCNPLALVVAVPLAAEIGAVVVAAAPALAIVGILVLAVGALYYAGKWAYHKAIEIQAAKDTGQSAGNLKRLPKYLVEEMGGEKTMRKIKAYLPGNPDIVYDPTTGDLYPEGGSECIGNIGEWLPGG